MKKIMLLSALATVSGAASAGDATGDWAIEGTIGQMPVQIVCTLAEGADKKVSGLCKNAEIGELKLNAGSVNDKAVSFGYEINFQGQTFNVSYNGTLESATALKGDIVVNGQPSGTFTAKKQ